jgi:hypothetical protein
VQHVVGPQANFIAGQTDDARIARPEHLDAHPAAQSNFFQPMYVVRISSDTTNKGGLSGGQLVQGNGFFNHDYQRVYTLVDIQIKDETSSLAILMPRR